MLLNSLGTTHELWDPNVPRWAKSFRVVRHDQRGHGASDVPPGPYSVEQLAADVLELMDSLEIGSATLCGISLGGATAMWLAVHAPERVDALVLACTAPRFNEPQRWLERAAVVRERGLEAIADVVVARWFTPGFAGRRPEVVARHRAMLVETPPAGYTASCEAVADWDFRERLGAVGVPTLVVAGEGDPATPPEDGRALAAAVPGAQLVVLPDAAHLANVEQAEPFSALVADWIGPASREEVA